MIRRLICWLWKHNAFEFPSGAAVCRRCWKWWPVMSIALAIAHWGG